MGRAIACALATGTMALGAGCQEQQLLALEDVEGMTLTEEPTQTEGYTYYVLQFDQPVNHRRPEGARFQQRVSLLHRDVDAPMVVLTTGYDEYYRDHVHELTAMLGANQISIEHRFFGTSLPDGDDLRHLTIEQMAHDQHQIIAKLSAVYPGAFLSTGHSKGGMTATYHRRFYPDDVVGTVAYVAPMSFELSDRRYASFQDTIGPAACRKAIRDAVIEMLRSRRTALRERAILHMQGPEYARARRSPESLLLNSLLRLEWAFWQYTGVDACSEVPATNASDDEMWAFLDLISPLPPDGETQRLSPYYVQSRTQLGSPSVQRTHLLRHLWENLDGIDIGDAAPRATASAVTNPGDLVYDGGAAMRDIHRYITTEGEDLLFIYGQWDPWSGGKYDLGKAKRSMILTQVAGTHNARLSTLSAAQRRAAFEMIERWTGVTPKLPSARARGDEPLLDAPRFLPLLVDAP